MTFSLTDNQPDDATLDFLRQHRHASLWQSPAWARFQRALGRRVLWATGEQDGRIVAAALVVESGNGARRDWQVPRGPLFTEDCPHEGHAEFLRTLRERAAASGALALYCSPLEQCRALGDSGFHPSGRHEQPEASIVLDLTLSDEQLLAQMKPKGRYNIGLSQRHQVWVEQSRNLPAYVRLARETATRDGFVGPSQRHLETFLDALEGSFLLLAYLPASAAATAPQEPIAGLLGVVHGTTGIYYYGASSSTHRNFMAPYALQWEALRLCRRLGATRYDLLGVAPEGAPANHPWAGVTDFKRKFGGTVESYPAEEGVILRPFSHALLRLKRRLWS